MSALSQLLFPVWIAVLTHLWQTTLVLVPLFLLARGLKWAPARLNETLWRLALLKLFLPLALCGGIAWELFDLLVSRFGFAASTANLPVVAAVDAVGNVLAPAPPLNLLGVPGNSWLAGVLVVLTVVWLLGFLWVLTVTAENLGRTWRLRSVPLDKLPEESRLRLHRLLRRLDIPFTRVNGAAETDMPAVVGLLKPRIILPLNLIESLPDEELGAILRHEESHRLRRDPLHSLLQRLCIALFFFYPPLYPILARLRENAEYACDEEALAKGIDVKDYTRALARSVQRAFAPAPLANAAGSGGDSLLRKRLQRLHRVERNTMSRYRLILVGAALLVGAGSFLPLSLEADTPPVPAAPASDPAAVSPPETNDDPPPPPPKKAAPSAERKVGDPPPPPKKPGKAPPAPEAKERFVTKPKLIHFEPPEYPEEARKAKAQGKVLVVVLVDENGKVVKAKVKQGVDDHPELDKAALKAAYLCLFEPGTEDGEAAKVWAMIPYKFKLE
jgi:TonB family protein